MQGWFLTQKSRFVNWIHWWYFWAESKPCLWCDREFQITITIRTRTRVRGREKASSKCSDARTIRTIAAYIARRSNVFNTTSERVGGRLCCSRLVSTSLAFERMQKELLFSQSKRRERTIFNGWRLFLLSLLLLLFLLLNTTYKS